MKTPLNLPGEHSLQLLPPLLEGSCPAGQVVVRILQPKTVMAPGLLDDPAGHCMLSLPRRK